MKILLPWFNKMKQQMCQRAACFPRWALESTTPSSMAGVAESRASGFLWCGSPHFKHFSSVHTPNPVWRVCGQTTNTGLWKASLKWESWQIPGSFLGLSNLMLTP